MQARTKSILKYAGYAGAALLLTLYFMFLTFPYSSLTDQILTGLKAAVPWHVSLGEIRTTPFFWIKVASVEISPPGEKAASWLNLSDLKVRPAILRMLWGKPGLRIKADLYQGTLKGTIGRDHGDLDLALSWKNLRAEEHPALAVLGGGKAEGTLSGAIDMKVRPSALETCEGTLSVELADGSFKAMQVHGFTIPDLQGVKGQADLRMGQRKADLEALSLEADQFSGSMLGKIDLTSHLATSRLNLNGKLKLNGELASQYEPMLAGFLRNKDPDGFYTFMLKGSVASPRFSL